MWRHETKSSPSTSASQEKLVEGESGTRHNREFGSASVVHLTNSNSNAASAATSTTRRWPLFSLFPSTRSRSPSDAGSAHRYQRHKKSDTIYSDDDSAASPALPLISSSLSTDKAPTVQEYSPHHYARALVVDQSSDRMHLHGMAHIRQRHCPAEALNPRRISDALPQPPSCGQTQVKNRTDNDDLSSLAAVSEQKNLREPPREPIRSAPGNPLTVSGDDVFLSDNASAGVRRGAPQTAMQQLLGTSPHSLPHTQTTFREVTASSSASFASMPHCVTPHANLSAAYAPAPPGFSSGIRGLRPSNTTKAGGQVVDQKGRELTKRRKNRLGAVALLSPTVLSPRQVVAEEAERQRLMAEEAERQRLVAEEAERAVERDSWAHAVQLLLGKIAHTCEDETSAPAELYRSAVSIETPVLRCIHAAWQLSKEESNNEVCRATSHHRDGDAIRDYGTVVHLVAAYTQTVVAREHGSLEGEEHPQIQRTRRSVLEGWQTISLLLPDMWRRAYALATVKSASDEQLTAATNLASRKEREPIAMVRQTSASVGIFFVQSCSCGGELLGLREVHANVVAGLDGALKLLTATAAAPAALGARTLSEMSPWVAEVLTAIAEVMIRHDNKTRQHVAEAASATSATDFSDNLDRAMQNATVQLREGSWVLWYLLRIVGLLAWWEGVMPYLSGPVTHTPHGQGSRGE